MPCLIWKLKTYWNRFIECFGFLSDVNDHQSDRSQQNSWINYTKKYLLFIGRDYEADDDTNILEPIVLSLGTLLSNTVKTCSIFRINHNPTAISITTIAPSVEGAEVKSHFSESGIENLRRKLIKQLKDILFYLDKKYEETSF